MANATIPKGIFSLKAKFTGGKRIGHLRAVASEFADGTISQRLDTQGKSPSIQLGRLSLLLLLWKEKQINSFGIEEEPWSKYAEGLRKIDESAVWMTEIFVTKQGLLNLIPEPTNGILTVNAEKFAPGNVNIEIVYGDRVLSSVEAIDELSGQLGYFHLPPDHIKHLQKIIADLLNREELSLRDKQLVAKGVWLGQLSCLNGFLGKMVASGGMLADIIDETDGSEKSIGGFTRETVVAFNTILNETKQRLRHEFKDEAKLVGFDVEKIIRSFDIVLKLTTKYATQIPCRSCASRGQTKVDQDAPNSEQFDKSARETDEQSNPYLQKIHDAAESASDQIKSFQIELKSSIQNCEAILGKLAKMKGS